MFPKEFAWGTTNILPRTHVYRDEASMLDESIRKQFLTEDESISKKDHDHINGYCNDFKIMSELGIKHYRFSVRWSEIIPSGIGKVNESAVSAYRDMILEMKKYGIEPYLTLYDCDYPLELIKRNGWLNSDSPNWFYEYAEVVARSFYDSVDFYYTINDPHSIVWHSNYSRLLSPRTTFLEKENVIIVHNILKAHGYGVRALRTYGTPKTKVGIAQTAKVTYPYTACAEDIRAAKNAFFGCYGLDGIRYWENISWFLDPIVFGHYPDDSIKKPKGYFSFIKAKDMQLISQPIDYIGLNVYFGDWITEQSNGTLKYIKRSHDFPKTQLGWPITPECIYWASEFLFEKYKLPIYITSNGAAFPDIVAEDNAKFVHDNKRVEFLDMYLRQLKRAIEKGIDIRGYYLCSLIDDYEQAAKHNLRFGIVYLDTDSQERIKKDSAEYYKRVCETNGGSV